MGMAKYVIASFRKSASQRSDAFKQRLNKWRKEAVIQRIERPTNPVRARELGYKAKKGYVVVRVRTKRGKRNRRQPDLGRKPGKNRKRENPGKEYKWYAEMKALSRHPNLHLVNSYWVGEDGVNKYFEIIMREPRLD